MSREGLEVRAEEAPALVRHARPEPRDRDALVARLVALERAYEDALARLERYEAERAIIKRRLEQLLASFPGPPVSA
jgi:hypothetical protein